MRKGEAARTTKETEIALEIDLDNAAGTQIDTGIGFFDHMLNSFATHGGFGLRVAAKGDLQVDGHHTVEDTGIVLGDAFAAAVGDKAGIARYGSFFIPMDEALAFCALDISGRPFLVFDVPEQRGMIGAYDASLTQDFKRAYAVHAGIKNALDAIGEASEITSDAAVLERADALILPGVGAFPDAMRELEKTGLIGTIRAQAAQKPLLGICLGMQILFETGFEFAECRGLGLIPGEVDAIPAGGRKIPHMGWNSLRMLNACPLLEGVPDGSYVYFVHSYMAFTDDEHIAAYTDYGAKIPSLVFSGNVYGAQFHPEKSGEVGLQILRNFVRLSK